MKIRNDDEGELTIAMYWEGSHFIIEFGDNIKWLGLTREQAQELALMILRKTADRVIKAQIE